MYINNYSIICMNTCNNKVLYLSSVDDTFKWTFKIDNALWFNFESEAIQFASNYFKTFKEYYIKSFDYYFNEK